MASTTSSTVDIPAAVTAAVAGYAAGELSLDEMRQVFGAVLADAPQRAEALHELLDERLDQRALSIAQYGELVDLINAPPSENIPTESSGEAPSQSGVYRVVTPGELVRAEGDDANGLRIGAGGGRELPADRESTEPFDVDAELGPAPAPPVEVGTVLRERFRLDERVAGGHMGVVYRATDLMKLEADAADPVIAVKVINPDVASNKLALRAFQNEVANTQHLSHPNIIHLFELDRDGDRFFITMEWLDGESLADRLDGLRTGVLPSASADAMFEQLCAALSYAHEHGVVHADVKPGNVFLTRGDHIKLIDFGVASTAAALDDSSAAGITPAYASCERLEQAPPTERDDLFSLACVIYRVLAGRRAFGPLTALEAEAKGMQPAPVTGLAEARWAALRQALAFRGADRQRSIAEFAEAFFRAEPAATPPPAAAYDPTESMPPELADVFEDAVAAQTSAAPDDADDETPNYEWERLPDPDEDVAADAEALPAEPARPAAPQAESAPAAPAADLAAAEQVATDSSISRADDQTESALPVLEESAGWGRPLVFGALLLGLIGAAVFVMRGGDAPEAAAPPVAEAVAPPVLEPAPVEQPVGEESPAVETAATDVAEVAAEPAVADEQQPDVAAPVAAAAPAEIEPASEQPVVQTEPAAVAAPLVVAEPEPVVAEADAVAAGAPAPVESTGSAAPVQEAAVVPPAPPVSSGPTEAELLAGLSAEFGAALAAGQLDVPPADNGVYFVDKMRTISADSPLTQAASSELAAAFVAQAETELGAGEAAAALKSLDLAAQFVPDVATLTPLREQAGLLLQAQEEERAAAAAAAEAERLAAEAAAREPAFDPNEPVALSELEFVKYVEPKYPRNISRTYEGWVDVVFRVGIDGRTSDIVVTGSDLPDRFEKPSVEAVAKWRFEPYRFNGEIKAVPTAVRLRFAR